MKFGSMTSAVVCCALLAACGGGDDTSTTPTPTPTPTSSPTPSPTEFNFANAFSIANTNTSYSFAYFAPPSGSEVWSDGARRDGLAAIVYAISPESVSFDWPDTATIPTFVAADLLTASPTLRTYRKGDEGLVMEKPFTHVLRVSFENKQPFTRNSVAGTLRTQRYSLFFTPVTTTTAITSNLTYSGVAQVVGGTPGSAAAAVSSPATTLTVTSSDSKIAGTIQIVETVGGAPVVRASLPISATVAANGTFAGTIDDTANAFKGSFAGSLAGATRQEAFLIFNVAHTDGREFIGSLIGD